MDENYECVGVGATFFDKAVASTEDRPEGGFSALWKKNLQLNSNNVILEENLIGLILKISSFNVVFINVYLNSDIWEITTLNNYLESLSKLNHFLDTFHCDCVFLMGDFNADQFYGSASRNISEYTTIKYLKCFDVDKLDDYSYTFITNGNSV